MNYLLLGLLVLVTGALMLGGRWARAARSTTPTVSVALAKEPPPDLMVTTLAGHPLRNSYGDGPKLKAWFSRLGALRLDTHSNPYVAGGGEMRWLTFLSFVVCAKKYYC